MKINQSMSQWIKGTLVIGAVSTLAACTNTSEDYAKAGDWNAVGYSDGIRGKVQRTPSDFKGYNDVDLNDYAQGYLKGIEEYCNPNHAYQIGLSGNYYVGTCEGTKDAQKFRMEWQRGWNDSRVDND